MNSIPYWWRDLQPRVDNAQTLPGKADVVVVGGGITGLSAALTLAKAGKDVVVLEKDSPGYGASSRNAGYLSKAHLHSLSTLIKKHSEDKAVGFVEEACKAFDYTGDLIASENIECQYQNSGRIYWAYTEKQARYLEGEHAALKKHYSSLQISSELLGSSASSSDIHSSKYCAGLSVPVSTTLQPGLYVQGLEERVIANGGIVSCGTEVFNITEKGNGFFVTTNRGLVTAGEVIVATNAYVGGETPYFRQRVIPVLGQMIALKPSSSHLLDKLLPNHIAHLDVRAMFRYWRRSPDNTHVLFGSRTGFPSSTPEKAAQDLKQLLVNIFPELADGSISNYWSGILGGTMDQFPHLGRHKGVHYATGMNGHGVPMGTYLGHKIALKLMGGPEGKTKFDSLAFKPAPLVKGKAWFMPVIAGAQALAEKMEKQPK